MAFRYITDTLFWSYLIKLLLDKFSFNAHTHNPSLHHSPKGLSHTMLWRRPSQPMINCHVFILNCLAFQVMGESELPLAFVIVHKICCKAPHKYMYLLTTIVPPTTLTSEWDILICFAVSIAFVLRSNSFVRVLSYCRHTKTPTCIPPRNTKFFWPCSRR